MEHDPMSRKEHLQPHQDEATRHVEAGVVHEALHHREVQLSNTPLMTKAEALEAHGINGDILAVMHLPGDDYNSEGKQVALIDFGDFNEGEEPTVFYYEGKPMKFFGVAKTRFGLKGLNYTPDSHMASYTPLYEGETKLGRAEGAEANYRLGLGDDEPGGNETLSRSHLTISLNGEGKISVRDHSTNGTGLETALDDKQNHAPEQDSTPTKGMITQVPKTGEEAASMLQVKEAENEDRALRERDAKAELIKIEMDELCAPFSEEVQMNLYRYAANYLNKRKAQQRDDGGGSIAHEQQAGQAYRALPPEAQKVADRYLALMDKRSRLLSK